MASDTTCVSCQLPLPLNSFLIFPPQINWGGDVPEKYFMSNRLELKKEDMEKVLVKRGSTFHLEVDVEVIGTAIR